MKEFEQVLHDDEMKHVFYSIIGRHAGENVDEIILRKTQEIEHAGFSLWSAKIDNKSIAQVAEIGENERVWVLCKLSPGAKDPTAGSARRANTMIFPNGTEKVIPEAINTTFGVTTKSYQAYVVRRYIKVEGEGFMFDFKKFESTLSTGQKKSFADRFTFTRFQNSYGKRNDELFVECKKPIHYLMELQYPFVVNLG